MRIPATLRHIGTIVWLKWRLTVNARRGPSATANALATSVSGTVYLVFALGLGALVVSMGSAALRSGTEVYGWFLAKALVFLLLYWVVSPVLFSPDREIFDVARFLPYPIAPGSLWLVHFLSTLLNVDVAWLYPALLGMAFLPAMKLGPAALPAAVPVLCAALAALAWRNLFTTILGGILKRRRLREVFILVVSLLAIVLQFWILMPSPNRRMGGGHFATWFSRAPTGAGGTALEWSPAGIAARGAVAGIDGPIWAVGVAALALVGVGTLGGALGLRVLLRFYVEPPQEGGRVRRGKSSMPGWRFPLLPDALVAVVEKEVKYLFRSTAGKWAILSSLVAFLLFLGAPGEGGVSVGVLDPVSTRAIGLGGFFLLMATRLCSNLFAWDGHGLKAYLLAPVPSAYILLGKGIAYGLLSLVQFLLAFTTLAIAFEPPTLPGFFGAAAWYLSALVVVLAAGTIFSVLFPQAENIQRPARKEQAMVGLLWFPLLAVAMAPGLGGTILANALGRPWVLATVMLSWCGVLLAFYGVILWWLSRELSGRAQELLEVVTEQVA